MAQFIYEISPLIYVFFPIPIMGKSTIENPHIFSPFQDNWKWTEVKHIIAWTFADYGPIKACTIYKHSEYGFLRFVYQEGMVVLGEIIYCLFKQIWTTLKL